VFAICDVTIAALKLRQRLEAICKRRLILETRLHAHYPSLRSADSLFPEFDLQSFAAIGHRGYAPPVA
jgi:hypothetical protein